jgi:hypothetical protein
MKAGPSNLSWTPVTQNTDGSAFDPTTQAGIQLNLDSQPAVSVPLASGNSFDMATLAAYQALKAGAHTASICLVTKSGAVSDPSNTAPFSVGLVPKPPAALAVA